MKINGKEFRKPQKGIQLGGVEHENTCPESSPLDQFMKWYEEYVHFDTVDSTAMILVYRG